MPVRAVVFGIGGVLEDTPAIGVTEKWEATLRLRPGELNERLGSVWEAGAIGAISEQEVRDSIARILRLDDARVSAFLADIWTEHLGTLNVELAGYLSGDLMGYSHEVGMSKPDPPPASPSPFSASSPATASASAPSR